MNDQTDVLCLLDMQAGTIDMRGMTFLPDQPGLAGVLPEYTFHPHEQGYLRIEAYTAELVLLDRDLQPAEWVQRGRDAQMVFNQRAGRDVPAQVFDGPFTSPGTGIAGKRLHIDREPDQTKQRIQAAGFFVSRELEIRRTRHIHLGILGNKTLLWDRGAEIVR